MRSTPKSAIGLLSIKSCLPSSSHPLDEYATEQFKNSWLPPPTTVDLSVLQSKIQSVCLVKLKIVQFNSYLEISHYERNFLKFFLFAFIRLFFQYFIENSMADRGGNFSNSSWKKIIEYSAEFFVIHFIIILNIFPMVRNKKFHFV